VIGVEPIGIIGPAATGADKEALGLGMGLEVRAVDVAVAVPAGWLVERAGGRRNATTGDSLPGSPVGNPVDRDLALGARKRKATSADEGAQMVLEAVLRIATQIEAADPDVMRFRPQVLRARWIATKLE
jgi:hypothetical protein